MKSSTKKSKAYANLRQFLNGRGFGDSEAHSWARCLYKYTDCGPWVQFVMKNGKEIYYEKLTKRFNPDKCVGLKVGCIVEGSDKEIGPECFEFPFTDEEFKNWLAEMDIQSSTP